MRGCATKLEPPPGHSLVPGSIGVAVRSGEGGVVVTAVRKDGPAAVAGLRPGELIVRYNGVALADPRQFYRLVVDSKPGSVARVEVSRDGIVRALDVPVRQLDTVPRV